MPVRMWPQSETTYGLEEARISGALDAGGLRNLFAQSPPLGAIAPLTLSPFVFISVH